MRRRSHVKTVLSLAALGACGVFVVRYFTTHRADLDVLWGVEPLDIAALAGLQLCYYLVHGYRYQIVIEQCSGAKLAFRPWFRIYVLGRFLNLAFPQMGSVYRGLRLKELYGISYTRYLGGFMSASWLGSLVNLIAAAAVVAAVDAALRLGNVPALWAILTLLTVSAAGPFLFVRLIDAFPGVPRYLLWFRGRLTEVARTSVDSAKDIGYLARVALLGIVLFALASTVFYLGFAGLGVAIGLPQVVLFFVLMQISNNVSITPGNLGVQEIAFGVLGLYLEVGMGHAMLISALLRVLDLFCLAALAIPMGGLGLLPRRGQPYCDRHDAAI